MNELPVNHRKTILLILCLIALALALRWYKCSMPNQSKCVLDLDQINKISTSKILNSTDELPAGSIFVNSASIEDLSRLPGIGPVKAKRIIAYRQKNGSFRSKEELINVKGIGVKTLKKIEEYINLQ